LGQMQANARMFFVPGFVPPGGPAAFSPPAIFVNGSDQRPVETFVRGDTGFRHDRAGAEPVGSHPVPVFPNRVRKPKDSDKIHAGRPRPLNPFVLNILVQSRL